jgi:hypothetical protein
VCVSLHLHKFILAAWPFGQLAPPPFPNGRTNIFITTLRCTISQARAHGERISSRRGFRRDGRGLPGRLHAQTLWESDHRR